MPLIRRGTGSSSPPAAAAEDVSLRSPDVDARWKAARALGTSPHAVPAIADALQVETSPQVREALFTSLVLIRNEESARAAIRFVRSDDAALRTGALDALAAMPDVMQALLPPLLGDPDSDVRILSCDLARVLPPDVATQLLSGLLHIETQPNVCGAAVEVLAEIGTVDAVGALRACKARFPDEAFLGFAIDDAIERAGAGRLDRNE